MKRLFFALGETKKYLVLTVPPALLNQEKRSCDGQEGARSATFCVYISLKIRVRTAHGRIAGPEYNKTLYEQSPVRHEGVCATKELKG